MPARVFVALELEPGTRELLASMASGLARADPTWATEKLVDPGLLHVTVSFLGSVPDPALPGLLARLAAAVAPVPAFDLRIAGSRAVPSVGRASMVWAVLDGDVGSAAALASRLAHAAGLTGDARPFLPHVTLVRARRPKRLRPDALGVASAAVSEPGRDADRSVSVRSATVFSSTLGRTGPTYERLAVLPLAEPDGGTL